jgi:hypothetical protein
MILWLALEGTGCKDSNTANPVDARNDSATASTVDGAINSGKDVASVRDGMPVDGPQDAPTLDGATVSVDSASDSAIPADAPVGCPAGASPGENSSPCPAGAVCEFSSQLACDAGCYGGSYVRFECIDNVWKVTRRTAGAPQCYCPPSKG